MELNLKRLESVKIQSDTVISGQEEIDRSLICSICQEIVKIPMECTNCHNNFCKKCIEQWMVQKNDSCPFRCPGLIKLEKSHKIILDSLRRLKFKCKNDTYGCSFTMNYDNYVEHTQQCEFNKINCPNEKCKIIALAKDMNKHLSEECEYHIHKCKICSFETIGPKQVNHECSKYAVSLFNDIKSSVENFMIKMNSKKLALNEKIENIEFKYKN
jgi:TNF receptor-associated factor 5